MPESDEHPMPINRSISLAQTSFGRPAESVQIECIHLAESMHQQAQKLAALTPIPEAETLVRRIEDLITTIQEGN